jgi:NADH-quinone oxidoreductase subunit C
MADRITWREYGAVGVAALRAKMPEAVVSTTLFRGEHTVVVPRERIVDVLTLLRDDPALRYDLLSDLCGVDYLDYPRHDGPRLAVVYNVYAVARRDRIRVKVFVDVEDAHVPTVEGVYPTANWHERETWDLFGIVFDGHSNLCKILTPEDLVGHPLRKDHSIEQIEIAFTQSAERVRKEGKYLKPER